MVSIDIPEQGQFTRGTGEHTIDRKHVVSAVPVQSGAALTFNDANEITYHALLYQLHDKATGRKSDVVPNWFGVAIPEPEYFDLSTNVYVVLYFHPRPAQRGAGYDDRDYFDKTGSFGTDWKQLFAYVDRLGGQMGAAVQAGARNNRLMIFPFLKNGEYTLDRAEWFNVLHDILRDINSSVVPQICTKPKKIIVATLSNGTFYLDKFLDEAVGHPNDANIIQAWDFDTEIVSGQAAPLDPHGKRLRAYWQARQVPSNTSMKTYFSLPKPSWESFPDPPSSLLLERPPLPPHSSNSTGVAAGDDISLVHHYIRDTMFLDAVWNIENDNPP